MKYLLTLIILVCSTSVIAEPPDALKNALELYASDQPEKFLQVLLRDSPLEGEKRIISQGAMIDQIAAYYGKAIDWEILEECKETSKLRTVYFIVYHEEGPVFGNVLMYQKPKGTEITINFQFHTEIPKVFPKRHIASGLCSS